MNVEAAWGMGAIILLILGLLVLGNDIALVVKRSKTLERRLRQELNAEGEGLGQLTQSLRGKIPPELYTQLEQIVPMRNRIVHVEGFDRLLLDRRRFIQLCDSVESALDALRPPRTAQTARFGLGCLIIMMAMAFIAYAISLNPM